MAARELDVEGRERELATQVVIAEQGRWYTALPRPLFAFAFIIYVWKVVVWDQVLGLGAHARAVGRCGAMGDDRAHRLFRRAESRKGGEDFGEEVKLVDAWQRTAHQHTLRESSGSLSMDVLDAVASRFSCRAFLPTPIPEAIV